MGITIKAMDKDSALNEYAFDITFNLMSTTTAGYFISGGETRSAGVVVPFACHVNRVYIAAEVTAATQSATNYFTLVVTNATKSATVINHIVPVIATCAASVSLSATADSLVSAGSLIKLKLTGTGSATLSNVYAAGVAKFDRAQR